MVNSGQQAANHGKLSFPYGFFMVFLWFFPGSPPWRHTRHTHVTPVVSYAWSPFIGGRALAQVVTWNDLGEEPPVLVQASCEFGTGEVVRN